MEKLDSDFTSWKIEISVRQWAYAITDVGLKSLSEKSPNIQYIATDINKCNKITAGLKSLSEGCHHIQHIDITFCSNITDAGLKSLCKGCHNIQCINRCYFKITDAGVKSLSEVFHNIQYINLSHCHNITDVGLKSLSEGMELYESLKYRKALIRCQQKKTQLGQQWN